jgi:hypothetical protein
MVIKKRLNMNHLPVGCDVKALTMNFPHIWMDAWAGSAAPRALLKTVIVVQRETGWNDPIAMELPRQV